MEVQSCEPEAVEAGLGQLPVEERLQEARRQVLVLSGASRPVTLARPTGSVEPVELAIEVVLEVMPEDGAATGATAAPGRSMGHVDSSRARTRPVRCAPEGHTAGGVGEGSNLHGCPWHPGDTVGRLLAARRRVDSRSVPDRRAAARSSPRRRRRQRPKTTERRLEGVVSSWRSCACVTSMGPSSVGLRARARWACERPGSGSHRPQVRPIPPLRARAHRRNRALAARSRDRWRRGLGVPRRDRSRAFRDRSRRAARRHSCLRCSAAYGRAT